MIRHSELIRIVLATLACSIMAHGGCSNRDKLAAMRKEFESRFKTAIEKQNDEEIKKLIWTLHSPPELSRPQVDAILMFAKSLSSPKVSKLLYSEFEGSAITPIVFNRKIALNLQPIGSFRFEIVSQENVDDVVSGELPIGIVDGRIYFCGHIFAE